MVFFSCSKTSAATPSATPACSSRWQRSSVSNDGLLCQLQGILPVWYAYLDIPADVRPVLGKRRFFKSARTGIDTVAKPRVIALVAGWRTEIAKARKTLADPKETFWKTLRRDFVEAHSEDAQLFVQEVAERAASRIRDPEEATRLYKFATDHLRLRQPIEAPEEQSSGAFLMAGSRA